ncbi:hypothetical protein ACFQVA_12425 [Actinomadura keratinilytica]
MGAAARRGRDRRRAAPPRPSPHQRAPADPELAEVPLRITGLSKKYAAPPTGTPSATSPSGSSAARCSACSVPTVRARPPPCAC